MKHVIEVLKLIAICAVIGAIAIAAIVLFGDQINLGR